MNNSYQRNGRNYSREDYGGTNKRYERGKGENRDCKWNKIVFTLQHAADTILIIIM